MAHIPKRFVTKTFNDYIIDDKNAQAKTALQNINQSYFIWGGCGTGKTFLACLIALAQINQEFKSFFLTSTSLFYKLNPFEQKKDFIAEVRNEVLQSHCLILDDLGAEKSSDWTNSTLFDVINHRYNENAQTIITSNFDIKTLQKRWGNYEGMRVGRRITEMCNPIFLQ